MGRRPTHGMSRTLIYKVWSSMRQRCYNPGDKDYQHYGDRGITVCESWNDNFLNFYKDMGDKPTRFHSLGRINNDGNYEPSNCRWETDKQQNYNRRFDKNHNVVKTHCPKGHEYTEENTYYYPDMRRECVTCRAERHSHK